MASTRFKFIASITVVMLLFAVSLYHPPVAAQENEPSGEPVEEISLAENELAKQQAQRQELENQLASLEKEIEEHQKTIEDYQKQGKTLKGEIGSLNARVEKLNLQIKAVNLTLTKLNAEINETQRNINRTENKIDLRRDAISRALRSLYEADRQGLAAILLAGSKFSEFFGNLNNISLVQQNLRLSLAEIVRLRQELLEQKEQLSSKKEDAENLRAIQQSQKKGVETTQTQKNQLLKTTRGKEAEYQKVLKTTQATAAQIRSRIFELLGGGELTFEKAYDLARLAEGATGVRAALTLAILHRESLLGKNVGRCVYNAIHPRTGKTIMRPPDIPYFEGLLKRLDLSPASEFAKVSCPIIAHGNHGGAMGPAQFIPSTWKLYETKIAAVTGNNPPSPWNNADAFAATAVYIRDLLASQSCKDYANTNRNVAPYQTLLERCAAAKYYAGSSWYTYRFWYGEPVVVKANEFEKDIQILKSSASAGKNSEG